MNNFKAYRWHCGTLYLLHRYNVPQTQVISGFLLTFITSIYSFLIYFETFFYDYDVTTLEIIHPITTRNYAKHPIKVLRNQITSCYTFLYRMYLIRETFLRY